MSNLEKQWYKVVVNAAHQGSGKEVPTTKYIYAEDAVAAREGLYDLRGWKRHGPINVVPLTSEEADLLEEIIPQYTELNLSKARRKGVHASRLRTNIDLSVILNEMLSQQDIQS